MQTFTARAPGKLFLMGEYAVLDGAPAIVAAVNREVRVRVEITDPAGRVSIEAPGLDAKLSFASHCIPPADGPLRFVLAAYHVARQRFPAICKLGLLIQTEDALRDSSGDKIGLGGSAA